MSDVTKLTEMVDGYPDQIQQMADSIAELTSIAADLQEQREAIENVVLAGLTADSDAYLTQKALDLTGVSCVQPCSYCTSGSYGVSNLTEWAIVSGGCPPSTHIVVFDSSDVSPTVDPEQNQRQIDFADAYDHIWKTVDATGTYGIKGTRDNVNTGKGIVQINKAKIEEVLEIYEKFT